jgi:glycosyltransferase involved in cell wall biosynthesis
MKPTAILYTPYLPQKPGAAGMRVYAIEKAFSQKGYYTTLLSPQNGSGLSLSWSIFREKPTIVMGTSPPLPPLLWVMLGSRLAGAQFILDAKEDGRAMEILKRAHHSLKEKMFLQLRRIIYSGAHTLWFLTESDRKEAMERYSLSPKKTVLVPNGTDPRLTYDRILRQRMRKEWGVKEADCVIAYAGGVGDEDVMGFIHALDKKASRCFLVFIFSTDNSDADQRSKKEIEEAINEKGFHYRIVENVPLTEMSRYLSGADVGVIPWKDNLPTSIPVKLFDYAGTGLPVAAKCPENGELSKFLLQNPHMGKSAPSWGGFNSILHSLIRSKTTQRAQKGKQVHHQWNRPHFLEGVIPSPVPQKAGKGTDIIRKTPEE